MDREEVKTRLRMLLIDRCSACRFGLNKCTEYCEFEQAVNMAIEALQDRPTGEWIKIGETDWKEVTIHVLHCQNCGALYRTRRLFTGEYVNANYCPNCGAKMGSDTK